MLERLNTLWFGGPLGYVEKLSVASALKVGHPVTIYSYDPDTLAGVPTGAEVADARAVMADERRVKLLRGKFAALGSDFFRYEVFAHRLGYWVDLDVLFLRPLDFAEEYVFGWEKEGSINGAVLRLPAGSKMLEELRNVPETNWRPPYFGPKRSMVYLWQRLSKGEVKLEDLPWGAAGPEMITYLAKREGLAHLAQPRPVFYPIPYEHAGDVFAEDASVVRARLTSETHAIHLWNSRLKEFLKRPPPAESFMAQACREHGVDCGL
jgi:hypothetical protein